MVDGPPLVPTQSGLHSASSRSVCEWQLPRRLHLPCNADLGLRPKTSSLFFFQLKEEVDCGGSVILQLKGKSLGCFSRAPGARELKLCLKKQKSAASGSTLPFIGAKGHLLLVLETATAKLYKTKRIMAIMPLIIDLKQLYIHFTLLNK